MTMGFSPEKQAIKELCLKKYHEETDTKLSEHEKEKLIRICVFLDIIKI